MAQSNAPTLLSQLWAQIEPTIVSADAKAAQRLVARAAFFSGVFPVLTVAKRAKLRAQARDRAATTAADAVILACINLRLFDCPELHNTFHSPA